MYMKRLLIILVVGIAAAPSLPAREQTLLARITVYWPAGKSEELAFFNGARLKSGHCAVDPKRIPFGSKVIFPDTACLAVDTGPAVISRTAARKCAKTAAQLTAPVIDRFFETKKQALAWAAAHPHFMTVRVQDPHHKATGALTDVVPSQTESNSRLTSDEPLLRSSLPNAGYGGLPPADIRGPSFPSFVGTALPRS